MRHLSTGTVTWQAVEGELQQAKISEYSPLIGSQRRLVFVAAEYGGIGDAGGVDWEASLRVRRPNAKKKLWCHGDYHSIAFWKQSITVIIGPWKVGCDSEIR